LYFNSSTSFLILALTVQHGYAVSTGVNLLASNYGVPPETHGGSGIYLSGDKTAKIYLDAKSGSKLVIQNVPNQKNKPNSTCISAVTHFLPFLVPILTSAVSGGATFVPRVQHQQLRDSTKLRSFEVQVSTCQSRPEKSIGEDL
jgi:hypothetical protein